MELAVKFQIKSPDKISLDEVLNKNPLVDDFISRSRWKSHIVQDTSIPSDADLGDVSTQWWTRFQATTSLPTPPQVVAPHQSGSKRPGGVKRASRTDAEESRDGENGDTRSNSEKPAGGQERRKRRKVSGETTDETSTQKESAKEMPARKGKAKEASQKTMFFNPVSLVSLSLYIF
jgi:hypothetical protein